MSLTPVLTDVGRDALLNAQLGGPAVVLSTVSIGSAQRAPTGDEVALTTLVATAPITSSAVSVDGQMTLNVQLDGGVLGIVGSHPVREIGVFDSADRLIFYWSTAAGALGALTPDVAYALSFEITLAPADAEVIEIVDGGPPYEALLEARLNALEAGVAANAAQHSAHRTASWRNLFLSF